MLALSIVALLLAFAAFFVAFLSYARSRAAHRRCDTNMSLARQAYQLADQTDDLMIDTRARLGAVELQLPTFAKARRGRKQTGTDTETETCTEAQPAAGDEA